MFFESKVVLVKDVIIWPCESYFKCQLPRGLCVCMYRQRENIAYKLILTIILKVRQLVQTKHSKMSSICFIVICLESVNLSGRSESSWVHTCASLNWNFLPNTKNIIIQLNSSLWSSMSMIEMYKPLNLLHLNRLGFTFRPKFKFEIL